MYLSLRASCFFKALALCLLLLLGARKEGYGQVAMERVYATSQTNNDCPLCLTIIVNNESNAVDQNIRTYSSLGITVLGTVWQQLTFPSSLSPGTVSRIKIGTGTDLLSLLGNITVQAYQGSSPVGDSEVLSSLISLIGGTDEAEVVFTPMNGATPVAYNSIRITSSGVALGGGLYIFDAYYLKSVGNDISCDDPSDVLAGSTGSIAGGLNPVENQYNSIDGNSITSALLRANVSALNKTHLTAIYNTLSAPGDSVKIIIQNPGGGLLDATLLAQQFALHTYNDNSDNGSLALDANILNLKLLPGSSDVQILTYPVSQPFNRIEISLGEGLVKALSSLRVYEISRTIQIPKITAPNINNGEINICEGEPPIALAIDNPVSGYEYHWFKDGNSESITGTSYIISSPVYGENHTYHVVASRIGCTEESESLSVIVNVLPQAGKPHLTITDIIN